MSGVEKNLGIIEKQLHPAAIFLEPDGCLVKAVKSVKPIYWHTGAKIKICKLGMNVAQGKTCREAKSFENFMQSL